jgi:hypothetical protein
MVGNGVLVHGRYGGGHHNSDDNNKNENERVVVVVARAPESVNSGRWGEWRLPFRGVSGSGLLSREIAYAIYDMYITLKISMRYFSPFLSLDLYLLPETNPAMGWFDPANCQGPLSLA